MGNHTKAIGAFLGTAIGSGVVVGAMWLVFSEPSGQFGVEQLWGMSVQTWAMVGGVACLILSFMVGVAVDDES